MKPTKKQFEELEQKVYRLESNYDNNINHVHWGLFWFIWILWIIVIIFLVVFFTDSNNSNNNNNKVELPKDYYENKYTFCEHFNMTFDDRISTPFQCLRFINDSVEYHLISKINNRWVFSK